MENNYDNCKKNKGNNFKIKVIILLSFDFVKRRHFSQRKRNWNPNKNAKGNE